MQPHPDSLTLDFARLDSDTVEIAAAGSLDESTVSQLRAQALGRGDDSSDRILIDLTRLEWIDSAGLAAIHLARIEIEARGGSMAVLSGTNRMTRTLERAGMQRFVNVATTRAAALRMLGDGRAA